MDTTDVIVSVALPAAAIEALTPYAKRHLGATATRASVVRSVILEMERRIRDEDQAGRSTSTDKGASDV